MSAPAQNRDARTIPETPGPPELQHYGTIEGMRLADELGVESRMLCGEWGFFSSTSGRGDGRRTLPICPKCQRVYEGLPE